jgi:hypothetical protein
MIGGAELLGEKNVVAGIELRQTTISHTEASPGPQPEHLVVTDPEGHFHQVHHEAVNPKGTYEAER